ncbi:MAG: peptidylprolyl isomerase [Luminiphilus sp.]|jgi:FKBP-type peptidyl-prolyl cis-trans isomerase SlpA|nr:peptidylprolyl isomerase [Halieaceae bacterium]MDG1493125.1 peptidylprolyl isomerase [Luminiphilus sp.]MBT5208679.1 peptidylprolyl isomerase [Halieaceae bacterium]MBT6263849.1 peptidylprolyl isomerase [Halieaceae bacterium]MBT7341065.1 peptidylprolyl isomerase [Halieaceae bacterium]
MDDLMISEGTRVTLNFALVLDDGSEIDSNFEKEPASFSVGDGSLLPGFERALFGLKSGDEATLEILPEEGFGQPNDNNLQTIKRDQFDVESELEAGMVFSFADAAGGELPGVVKTFDADEVTVDFNHPLAGRTLSFRVAIHNVEVAELH